VPSGEGREAESGGGRVVVRGSGPLRAWQFGPSSFGSDRPRPPEELDGNDPPLLISVHPKPGALDQIHEEGLSGGVDLNVLASPDGDLEVVFHHRDGDQDVLSLDTILPCDLLKDLLANFSENHLSVLGIGPVELPSHGQYDLLSKGGSLVAICHDEDSTATLKEGGELGPEAVVRAAVGESGFVSFPRDPESEAVSPQDRGNLHRTYRPVAHSGFLR